MLSNAPPKILIVDDERRNLKILTDLLRDDAEVYAAKGGEQALDRAGKLLPDLILLDIVMPDMDGFEVLRQLKQDESTARIAVIFITGLNTPDEEKRGLTLGAQDYIYKPFCPEVVKSRVATQLKIVRQTKQLQQAMLKDKTSALGTLTAGIAHEINNPANFAHVGADNLAIDLANFRTFLLELAGEDADPQIINEFKAKFEPLMSHIDTIKDGTQRIKSIVKDLWTITRSDGIDKVSVDIGHCIVSTVNLVSTNFLDTVTFSTDIVQLPSLYGYPSKLSQVFMNVLVNAAESIERKQQKSHSTKRGEVNITCRDLSGSVQITIEDNGGGMDEMVRQKMFEPFFTTKKVGDGTGLGMSIALTNVQEHDGSIKATTTLGEKSLITIILAR
jgi:signal transduction histidine kinase